MNRRTLIPTLGLMAVLGAGALTSRMTAAPGDVTVTPGEFYVEHPTLINLGFEWRIDGDANRNAKVDVSYRKQGETAWKTGMPLVRLQNERVWQPAVFNLVTPNMFAGSILDLEPDTAYETRFVMSDPDGVSGPAANATKTVTVRTRPEPKPAAGGMTYHVYPTKWQGPKLQPSFEGIMCAYNYWCGAGDTAPGGRPRVKAGDTILVHAGIYAYHWEFYGNQTTVNATTTFEGTYYLNGKGTPEKPIVIKAAGDGEVILDGRGNFNLFNVKNADYNYFEGITFRNTSIAIWAGTQFQGGAKGLTVKRCRFEDVGMGIFTNYSGSSDFYIADNVLLGRNDHVHLTGWNGAFWQQFEHVEGQEYPPVMKSYTGIRVYGPGHVIAYNYVADFHDGIDTEMYGMPDGSNPVEGPTYPPQEDWDRRPTAIDLYNNYITNAHDNSIEMDGSMHNIRIMRNMLINSASHPISNQPSVGGPSYWIRNVVFNAPGGSTRLTANSPGVIYYNNTILTETSGGSASNVHWRNNLMLPANALPAIFTVNTSTNYSSSDYNGFGVNPNAEYSFAWNSPPWDVAALDPMPANGAALAARGRGDVPPAANAGRGGAPGGRGGAPAGTAGRGGGGGGDDAAGGPRLEQRRFKTLAEYQAATKQDQHSVMLDYNVLVNVPKLDGKDLATVQKLYDAKNFDFRLKAGSAAVDKGIAIPNVTDGFSGTAPDLGAIELGQPGPIWGPRPVSR